MAISPTGIIPEALMFPSKLGAVMQLIKTMAAPGDFKESLLIGWCRTVGVRVNASQRATVRDSGWDYTGPTTARSTRAGPCRVVAPRGTYLSQMVR